MNTFAQVALLIAVIVLFLVVFNLYARMLSKISQRGIKRRIEKGKVSDKQLIKLYQTSDKGRKRTGMAIFMYGIFYKSFLKMQDDIYQVYQAEMKKRGLLNQ